MYDYIYIKTKSDKSTAIPPPGYGSTLLFYPLLQLPFLFSFSCNSFFLTLSYFLLAFSRYNIIISLSLSLSLSNELSFFSSSQSRFSFYF